MHTRTGFTIAGFIAWLIAAVAVTLMLTAAADGDSEAYRSDILLRRSVLALVGCIPLLVLDISKFRLGKVDLLMTILAAAYIAAGLLGGRSVSFAMLQEAVPYAAIYVSFRIFVGVGGGLSRIFIFTAVCVWSCCESVHGLMQAFGYRMSGHSIFGMTGSFSNPGPYGGFIAMAMATAGAYLLEHRRSWRYVSCCRNKRWILFRIFPMAAASLTIISGITVLPASMSRAAWLSLLLSLFVCAVRTVGPVRDFYRRKPAVILTCIFAAVLCTGMFFIKRDSALGRLHIWNMEIRAVLSSPVSGSGPGTALASYADAQEAYFRSAERSATTIKVAGCPEYAFNEYLKTGMETGIPGLALLVALTVVAVRTMLKHVEPFGYGLLGAAIFSFFSYPLDIVPFAVLILLCIAVAGSYGTRKSKLMTILPMLSVFVTAYAVKGELRERSEAFGEWKKTAIFSTTGMYEESVENLSGLYPHLFWNFRYLYDYGYALHKTGNYGKSNEILSEGTGISSDPMFHNIIGKNYEAMGAYADAEKEYMRAHCIVPCRVYPLVLLYDMYRSRGMAQRAELVRNKIEAMPVNDRNKAMIELVSRISREKEEE